MSTSNRPRIMGTVEAIFPEWVNDAGTFRKQEIVVETGFKYPNPIKVTFKNDNLSMLGGISAGDKVIVEYGIDGRKWDGPNGTKYFVDIAGLSLEKIGGGAAEGAAGGGAIGMTLETCMKVWAKHHGNDIAGFAAYCKKTRPDIVSKAESAGQKFTDYARNMLDVWAGIANKIEADAAAVDEEDLPF